jgi:hypothetical protein
MEVVVAGAKPQVVVDEPAGAEIEGGHVLPGHAAVEDEAGVGAALVGGEEVDDRVAAHLLLAVEGDPDVHRQLSRLREERGGLQQEVRVALVVDGAAAVDPPVADLRLEGRRLPEVERRGRLDVEVAVQEDGGRIAVPRGGGNLAEGEGVCRHRVQLGPAPRLADEVADPLTGAADVGGVRRIGAHARDAQELEELLEPSRIGPLVHGRNLAAGGGMPSNGPVVVGAGPGRPGEPQATSLSFCDSASACSFFRLWFSIWRTRSRVTLNVRPTSSSVRGCCPSSP